MNPRRQRLVETYYNNKIPHIELVVDNFENPHDISAIARSADGLGIKKIHLYYTYIPCPDMQCVGKKSSASANKWIIYEQIDDLAQFYSEKRDYNFVAILQQKKAISLHEYQFNNKTILVVPSPEKGLSPELKCEHFVSLPLLRDALYSTSTATAVTLYEIFSQLGKHLTPLSSLIPRRKRD
ncbi:TrmH family RNA methyltransferase [Candidatus Uabimicrobium sp. HlEnr_7]|uniref:TrmH family RNA methyltransferase n=1 Tax=Candidatus Uabimicrobium helgolandensis TaxID=3095367 RepID=UPI00355916DB